MLKLTGWDHASGGASTPGAVTLKSPNCNVFVMYFLFDISYQWVKGFKKLATNE